MASKVANLIDSAIGVFAPKIGYERAANRARMQLMQAQVRRYEGASTGRRSSSWSSQSSSSVNKTIAKDHTRLVQRSRELYENNAYAKKAPYVIANNVVGSGILPTINVFGDYKDGEYRENPKKAKLEKTLSVAWNEWADSVDADYNGDNNFYGLQHLAVRTLKISGEVLAVKMSVSQTVNKFGFQVLLLEGDYLDSTKDSFKTEKNGSYVYRGIKYDKRNKKIGYFIYDRHPNEVGAKSELYDAKDVIHLYDVERTGQNRGVPATASTMTTQRDFSDYMDAELLKQKAAACFSAVVQKADSVEDDEDPKDELEHLEPGAFHYLNAGETIHFPSLPQNPGLTDFTKVQLRSIAAGYLMPYENLSGDLSNVTFISGRLGQIDFKKQVEYWQHTLFIPKFCDRVFEWFKQHSIVAISFDANVNVKASWTAPRWVMMDPAKEINAMREEVRAGFSTWSEKVRENGYDPAAVLEQMKKDQADFISAGLMPTWSQFFELSAKTKPPASAGEDPGKK
ncbi:phage portal protein [Terrimonas sp. NA20]|uniref:Phage portal protein n=1 Tax=Terrimonas ginsenosidimutans TaxID=2908004 RepID=A0ABS9KRF6_9BACT|nr:phage portal protein [Terrimonas ginsenosidimutans]MCG2614889.1 phage portal protein [Terrimonas ginsenosidimutans]